MKRWNVLGVLLVVLITTSGCGKLTPGNIGWFCSKNEDCKQKRCLEYQYRGMEHKQKLCTGTSRLRDSSWNYNWVTVVMNWVLILSFPGSILLVVVYGWLRNLFMGGRRETYSYDEDDDRGDEYSSRS